MLYLGIDQHARQITISLRDDHGDVVLARQVSTEPKKIDAFFQQLTRRRKGGPFVAVLEVCGFNDWLIRRLRDFRCHKVILIQPDDRKNRKTDRRDAAALSEVLWVNRERLLHGQPVRGLRQVDIASTTDQENRRLTTLRKEAGQARARIVNKIRHMLRRHNLQWEMPTKRLPTLSAIAWLKQVSLVRDRSAGDESPACRSGASAAAPEGTGGSDRPALRRQQGSGDHHHHAWREPFHRHRAGVSCGPGRALPAGAQPGQLLGPHARLPQQRREQSTPGKHHQGRQRHGQVATGPSDAQSLAEGLPVARVVQTHQTPKRSDHCSRRRDAKAGYDSLAHAEQTKDVCGVPSTRGGMTGGRFGFSAWVPIPNGRGRHRAAPFGVGPWDGARVASTAEPYPPPRWTALYQATVSLESHRNKKER